MQVDFGRTADDYVKHRAGFPERFFQRLVREEVLRPGLRAVDLGTGTGTLARGLARHGCQVTALDISASMLEGARQLAATEEVSDGRLSIDWRLAPAENTGLPEGSAELVIAGQCWHWFDRAAAAREASRLLVPGGRLVIAHFDWVPLPGNIIEATEHLIDTFNPGPVQPYIQFGHGTGLYPAWFKDAAGAGFTGLESFSFDVAVPYTHEAWRGRVRASAKIGASLAPEQIARFDAALASLLAESFPANPLAVPHRVFALMATRP